jgi:hypothetical protein
MGYAPMRSGHGEGAPHPILYRCHIASQAPVKKKHQQRLTALGNWVMAFFRHCRESRDTGLMENNFERS